MHLFIEVLNGIWLLKAKSKLQDQGSFQIYVEEFKFTDVTRVLRLILGGATD